MISQTSGNKEVNNLNFENKIASSNNYADKIILANKGEAAYIPGMDLDDDGIITLSEFNKYCEENSVSDSDKLKLLSIMQGTKDSEVITKSEDEKQKQKHGIYAVKGDKKYVKEMDENNDSKITNEEYLKYCQNRISQESKTKYDKISAAYSPDYEQKEEISVDVEI